MNKMILKSKTTKVEVIFNVSDYRFIRHNMYGEPIKIHKAHRTTIIETDSDLVSTTWSYPTMNGFMKFDSQTTFYLEKDYNNLNRKKKIEKLTNG